MPVRVFLSTRYSVEEPRRESRSSPMSLTLSPRYSVSSAATEPLRYPLIASTSATLLAFGTASPHFDPDPHRRRCAGKQKRTVLGPPVRPATRRATTRSVARSAAGTPLGPGPTVDRRLRRRPRVGSGTHREDPAPADRAFVPLATGRSSARRG